jgi:PEP-CTERM motif
MRTQRSVGMPVMGVVALALLLGVTGTTKANLITFSSRTAFQAAAGNNLALADFQGLGGNTYQTLSHAVEPSVPAGVTLSSTGGTPFDIFVAPGGFNGNTAIATDSAFGNNFGTPLILTFSPNVTAVGADVIPFDFSNNTGTIAIAVQEPGGGTSMFSVTPPQGLSGFFGVIARNGESISSITFTPTGNVTNAGVDNLLFGQSAPPPPPPTVPEPSSLALLSLGSLGLAGWRRWRKRATA